MARRSNKAVVEILASSFTTFLELDRKIALATEGFATNRFCELVLKDRNRLSKENALTISNYIVAMKREINPRLNTIRTTIQFLSELSKSVGIAKKFKSMKRDDIFSNLDKCRKLEQPQLKRKEVSCYKSSDL
jgi:hypothetical protein